MTEGLFYAGIFSGLYFGVLILCWKRWTQEDREMQAEKEKFKKLCEEADRIINSKQGGG